MLGYNVIMVNELVWRTEDTNGTSLRSFIALDVEFIAAAVGAKPNADGYVDDERGYDGFEVTGRFNGEVFKLYRRWGQTRIGGHDTLDTVGLTAALRDAVSR